MGRCSYSVIDVCTHTLTPQRDPWLLATKPSGDEISIATAANAGGLGQARTDQMGDSGEGM